MTIDDYRHVAGPPWIGDFATIANRPHVKPTQRRERRERRDRNRAKRAWLLAIGPDRRALMRLDPPCDYDDIPF